MKMLTRLALKNNKKNKTRSILIMLVIFFEYHIAVKYCSYLLWQFEISKG